MPYRYTVGEKPGGIIRETRDEVLKDLVSIGLAAWVGFTTSRAKLFRRDIKIIECAPAKRR